MASAAPGIKQTGKLKRDVYAADGKFNHFEADRNNEPFVGILNKDGICCTGIKQTGKLKRDVYAADGKFNHFELFLVPEISEGR
jgi:hypothetical protein